MNKVRGACQEQGNARGKNLYIPHQGSTSKEKGGQTQFPGGRITGDGRATETSRKEGYKAEESWFPSALSNDYLTEHARLSPCRLVRTECAPHIPIKNKSLVQWD